MSVRETSMWSRFWNWWTPKGARAVDDRLYGRSTVLSWVILFLLAWVAGASLVLRFAIMPDLGWSNSELLLAAAFMLVLLLAQYINVRGRYATAAVVVVGSFLAAVYAGALLTLSGAAEPYYGSDEIHMLAYLALPVVLGAVLLQVRHVLAMLVLVVIGVGMVPLRYPHVSWEQLLYGPLIYVVLTSVLLAFVAYVMGMVQRRYRADVEWREERYRSLFKAEREGVLVDEPVRMRRLDGTPMDCLITLTMRRDQDGAMIGYQTIVRDVTARRQLEQEARLRAELIEMAFDPIYLVDPTGEIVFANQALADLTGYPVDELVGMNIRRLNASEYAEQVPDRIARMLRDGALEFETTRMRKDGSRVVVEVRARTIHSLGQTLFLSVDRDITARRASEAELRLRGELLDLASDSVFLHDLKGSFIYVNKAAAAARGYTREEMVGMQVSDIVSPESASQFRTRMAELMNRRAMTFDSMHVHKDGRAIPVETRLRLVEHEGQALVLSVARDMTERRARESSLRRTQSSVDRAAIAVFWITPEGEIAYANERAAESIGYNREELVGLRVWDFDPDFPPEKRPSHWAEIRRRGNHVFESRHRHRDGTVHPVRITSSFMSFDGEEMEFAFAQDITAEKEALRALQESEERYRVLVENQSDLVVRVDSEGRFEFVSPSYCRLFAKTEQELIGQSFMPLVHPDDRESTEQAMRALSAPPHVVHMEQRAMTSGGWRWLQWVDTAILDSDGNVVSIIGVGRDITDTKLAEQQLRESEEKYREVFQHSPSAICLVSLDGTLLDANPAYLSLYGLEPEDIGVFNVSETYEDSTQRARFLQRIRQSGFIPEEEVVRRRKDGTPIVVMRSSVVKRDADGDIVAFQTYTQDVTARKRAEEQLRNSEQRYRELFEQSMDAVALVSYDGTLLEANEAYWRLFGYEHPVANLDVRKHMVDEDRAVFLSRLEAAGFVVDEEVRQRKADGTIIVCFRSAVARRDEQGRIVLIQTLIRDVTEMKRAEADLRESEQKYRTLFEQSLDAVAVYTVDGTLLDANQAHLDLLAIDRDRIGTRTVLEHYVDPSEREAFLDAIRANGFVADEEVRLKKADGTEMDCLRSAVGQFDQHGVLLSVQTVTKDITDRKRAERELRESEEKYRALFEQSIDPVALIHPDGTILDANQAYLSLFGYTPEDIGRRKVLDRYIDPAERERFWRRLEEQGAIVDEEVERKKPDGTRMWCLLSAVARRDANGRIVAMQTVSRDITERKRAEEELRESETRFRALIDRTGLAMTITRTDGTFIDCNDAFLALLGYGREELRTLTVPDWYANRDERERVLANALRDGYVRGEELDFRRKDGTTVAVTLTSALIPLHGETVVVAQYLDITERKRAEAELRESEARFRSLVENTGVGIVLRKTDGSVIECNDIALGLFGYSREEFSSLSVNQLYVRHEDYEDTTSTILRDGFVRGRELELKRKDGSVMFAELTSTLVPLRGQMVVISELLDISERKAHEQELKESGERLALLAQYLENAREDERTGIARELHDQLGQAITALKLDLGDITKRLAEGSTIPAEKLAAMDVLLDQTADDVRRMSSELRPGVLDDFGLVTAMEWQLAQFRERTELETSFESNTDEARIDRAGTTALFRVFQELLTNVARHANATKVNVVLTQDADLCVLTVADDGKGMSEEDMTSPTSLGLIGMRERVRPLGGYVSIQSAPGKGTAVTVSLPIQ